MCCVRQSFILGAAGILNRTLRITVNTSRASLSTLRPTQVQSFSALPHFKFTHAITRAVPQSFARCSVRRDASHEICLSSAIHQLQHYIESLQRCGVEIITLPANEEEPDCVFIEDTALVIGQRACLTRPALTSRRGEVPPVRDVLQKFGIETIELDDPSALLDGGDIIYTGQEILVGSSSRTNRAGIESLQRTFPEMPVTSIPIHGTLHLKSVATLAEADLLVIGGSSASQSILQVLKSRAQGQYRFLQLNGDIASNVIHVNSNVLVKPAEEIGVSDFKKLTEALSVPWIEVPFSEFYKADGCLSCCSVLIQAGN